MGTDHMRTTSLKCPLNKNYEASGPEMIGWRGSGRGTSVEKIQTALLKRGVDISIIQDRFGSEDSQSNDFYEESQRPQEEYDDNSTPDDNDDSTPDDNNDSTLVNNNISIQVGVKLD